MFYIANKYETRVMANIFFFHFFVLSIRNPHVTHIEIDTRLSFEIYLYIQMPKNCTQQETGKK